AADPNVMRFLVENLEDLPWEGVKSDVKRIDGFPWRLNVLRNIHNEICTVIACRKSIDCEVWECIVEGEVKLINHTDNSRSVCKEFEAILDFHYMSQSVCVSIVNLDDVIGDENFVTDGCVIIEAKIVVKERNEERFRSKSLKPDFFSSTIF
ncbi:hypothetical protein PENTCL1PPCAC_23596, partial [Pristionchus entomophagus]